MGSTKLALPEKLSFKDDLTENVIHTITDLLRYDPLNRRELMPESAKTPEHFLLTRLVDLKTALSGEQNKQFMVEEVLILNATNATQKASINQCDHKTFPDVTRTFFWENNVVIAGGELHRRFEDCIDWFSIGLKEVSSKASSAAVDSNVLLFFMELVVRACVINGFFHKKSENANVCEAIRKLITIMPQYVLLGQSPNLPGTWLFLKMY